MEIQRLSCVDPGSLPHIANDDGYLDGYKIPKGTLIMYNIYKFHMDPDQWEDPEIFNPGRFLDGGKKEQFVPFGMGKRICMGESLAKNELFIFFTLSIVALSVILSTSYHAELCNIHIFPSPPEHLRRSNRG